MRSLRYILSGLFFSVSSTFSWGCNCLWQGPFNAVYPSSDLVIYGEVSDRRGNSIDVQIAEIFHGQEFRDSVRVWGKMNELCRPSSEEFPPGSQWVMALTRIDSPPDAGFDPFKPNVSFGRKDDYFLSSCGVSWLPVKSGRVSGNILEGARWQYIDEKKTPIILPLFTKWLTGDLNDNAISEAAKPSKTPRELLNKTRIFLWEQNREEDESPE